MLCFPYFCGFAGSESQLLKTGVAEDRLPKMSPICTMLWHEGDWEVNIAKNWQARYIF